MRLYIILFSILIPSLGQSQWVFPWIELTDSDSISYLPYNNSHAIAVQGQIVHVVFTDRRDGAGEVFYKRSLDGGINWEADRRLTVDDNIFSGRATIAVWSNEVHIVWMDRRDGNNELYYKRSANNGNTWGDDVRLTNNGSNSEYPSMALEFQTLHLAWNDDRNGQNEIYYKRSINGGLSWTSDIRLTNNTGDSFKPSVAVSDTLVHIMWEDQRNGTSEIYYKGSSNSGMTWSNDFKMSNSASDCYAPCISANGTIAFATWDDNRAANSVIYGRRTIDGGVTWGSETNYTNTSGDCYNAYHVFSGTYMCMLITVSHNGDSDLYLEFSTDAGLTWTGFIDAVTTSFAHSEQPFLAISGAGVHVVYQDDYDGNFEILYTRNPTANPLNHQHQPVWAQQINSPQTDIAYAMTSDIYSNIYVAGSFSGTVDFDPGPGIFNLTSLGSTDAYVYKMTPEGSLLWAKRIGGPQTDNAFDIALDSKGNIVLTGAFHATVDFDPGPNVMNISSFGQEDVFVEKLDKDGNFIWTKRVGGDGRDEPQSIAITESNDIYITGYFEETADFDPGPNNTSLVSQGDEDIFIFSLYEQGEFSWAKSIGSTGFDAGRSIAVNDNSIVVTGGFRNTADFDPGDGQQDLTSSGENDIFILQINTSGELVWVRQFGGTGEDEGNAIIMDAEGNTYATGYSTNTVTPSYKEDVVVYALRPSGDSFWIHRTGKGGSDAGQSIAINHGNLYVAGMFEGIVDFHPGSIEIELKATGGKDIYLQKLDAQDGELVWLNQFGGSMQDVVCDVAVVPFGKIGVTGYFSGIADFSPSIQQKRFISAGEEDGFVTLVQECEPSYDTLVLTACSILIFNNDYSFSESGTYTILTESASGCDSIITLQLTILDEPHSAVTATNCESYTTPSGNHTWTETGVYQDTVIAVNGCDSIITFNITINRTTFATVDIEACKTYTTPEGDHTWTQSGLYTYSIPNAAECDSNITLNLLIFDWDTAITQEGATLTAVAQPVSYQWLDCNAAFAIIVGETSQSFTAITNGIYAVAIGTTGCMDTSSCYPVEVVGVQNPGILADAFIFPNPTNDNVYIQLANSIPQVDVELTDLQSRAIWKKRIINSSIAAIELPPMPGIYLITLNYNAYTRTFRVVKM